MVEAKPYVAQRYVLDQRLGYRHGQHAPGGTEIQSDIQPRPYDLAGRLLAQYFTAGHLLEMGFYLERWQEIEEFEDEQKMLKKYINENLWDEKEHFLSINTPTEAFPPPRESRVLGLIDRCPVKERMDAFVAELDNKETFNRLHRVLPLPPTILNTRITAATGRVAYGRERTIW